MDPPKAVFLSYSSHDAEAAERICEALRGAGIEVWFDKSELRGGDAWDASIRKQIKDCALFVPVISGNTNARAEGYFRLEWKLAVDRSHLMADDQAFLLPVAIDDTPEATARVPDRFRELQWSRTPNDEAIAAFAKRAAKLLTGRAAPATPAAPVARPAPSDSPSIAVLPFVNMSRDEENEIFADGLSEELLNVLAKIRGLRVASRTSAFYFKGKDIDIPAVAQKLNVATILEGSVRKSGKRVRITAQLIEVATDSHLWSETYDRELDDIFAVQDDIAQAVVTELRAALLGEHTSSAAKAEVKAEVQAAAIGRTDNPQALQLCLQGRFFTERMTEADLARAVDFYKQALALDPEFARAWAGLSRAYWTQAGYGWAPVEEGFRMAREAAERSIAIAPDLADGHVALAHVLQGDDWDWQASWRAFEHALALAPGNADVLRGAGGMAGILGKREESLELLRKAAALDPLSASTLRLLGLRCVIYGDLDEGVRALHSALDLNPKAGLVNCFMSIARLYQGDARDALEWARREVLPDFQLFSLALCEHTLGHKAESDKALDQLIKDHGHAAAYQVAEAYCWRGENERGFEWLERAYVQRDPGLSHTATDSFFKPLHGDPRWRPFLVKMRLVAA
jgi:TolB-like protein/Tfp pilus assembly protein PilF